MSKIPSVETDILIIGGGPSGLSTAIHLADLITQHNQALDAQTAQGEQLPLRIMVLEKGGAIGNHILSGAVINPAGLKELLPDVGVDTMPFEAPVSQEDVRYLTETGAIGFPFQPPYFDNHGNYVASLGRVTQWLAEIAEKKGVQIFPGFSGEEVLYEQGKVVGVRTGATGIDHHGNPMDNYQPPTDVRAKITVFAEGTRGSLTKKVVNKLNLAQGCNPQIYSLGVKEVWEVPEGNIEPGYVAHTLGFPLTTDQFGGGFIYGLSKTTVAIGMAVGLDYTDPTFDTHHALQVYKKHPFVARFIQGGKMVRYGAKTIPEGGLYAIPQLYHDNMMIVGDSAGLVAMPSLKGIHLGVRSGMLAAKTAFEALKKGDTSLQQLRQYEQLFNNSDIYKELYPVRNFRQAFKSNLFLGMVQFGTQLVTGGRGLSLSGRLAMAEDYRHYKLFKTLNGNGFLSRRKKDLEFDKVTTFDKEMDVYFSGTKHDEEQPSHIQVSSLDTCLECVDKFGAPCQHFCPAEVFEIVTEQSGRRSLSLHPSNCVHCKTCDIKDPYQNVTWTTPYGGDGPEYANM